MYAIDEDDSENVEESAEDENDLQAWCLLEESESEQWQEVIIRRNKQESEESQSSFTVERGEQSKFESEEDHGGERHSG